jgi:hypothetical protein
MYFAEHPYPTGFSVSTKKEMAVTIEGKEEAMRRCDAFTAASGFNCGFVSVKK